MTVARVEGFRGRGSKIGRLQRRLSMRKAINLAVACPSALLGVSVGYEWRQTRPVTGRSARAVLLANLVGLRNASRKEQR